jgi:hypothetical protein
MGRLRNNWRRVPADGLKGLIDSYVHAHGTSSHTSGRTGRQTAQLKAILHFVSGTMNELGTHKDSSRHAVLARRRKTLRRSFVDLESANFFCLQAFLAFRDFEFYALTLSQAAEAVRLNRGVMHKNILTALALDKTKAFGVVKPLHCSLFH